MKMIICFKNGSTAKTNNLTKRDLKKMQDLINRRFIKFITVSNNDGTGFTFNKNEIQFISYEEDVSKC